MGANAQTSVPTFTAGEVLTAANMNISARTGVPVFSNTTTRDAGFGGTGEKTLAEGQLCYLEDSNVVQYYDGAAWATVGPTTVSSALTFISATTIGNAVASVTVSSAFSSTYANYVITLTGGTGSASSCSIGMQLGSATTEYYQARLRLPFTSASPAQNNVNNGSSWSDSVFRMDSSGVGNGWMVLIGPNLAQNTQFYASTVAHPSGGDGYILTGGVQNSSTQFTAFTLTPASGTITGGVIRVYGVANS